MKAQVYFREHRDDEQIGCVVWPFGVDHSGYGKMRWDGVVRSVHQVACELAYGPKPTPDHEAAHARGCVRACFNKQHLRWATRSENEQDKVAEGRSNRTPDAVRTRVVAMSGMNFTQQTIAHTLGLGIATVERIIRAHRSNG